VTVDDGDWLTRRFEAHRSHLRAVAYRMLGSVSEADDAVQESWLHVSRSGTTGVENLGGWLTTVVARVCLDMLRSRRSRREEPLTEHAGTEHAGTERADPEHEALLADSVGLALLVVLDTLAPAERLAFVLHDMFDVPFDEIAQIVGRSPAAARQLASRARRRVRGADAVPDADPGRRREVVGAFLAAARAGDFGALLALLDPDVVAGADSPATEVRGARTVAEQALMFSGRAPYARLALVDGAVGIVLEPHGRLSMVMLFTVERGRIVGIEVVMEPARLESMRVAVFGRAPDS
jgi:RNA polymerase sigma-70 factor (ECF subfamily)